MRRVPVERHRGQDPRLLHQAGLLDTEEFDAVKDDVTDLARDIVSEVESSFGM
jgi:hypothetical protein